MNPKNQKITIIILNWNGWNDTIECLESLYQINYPNYDIILIDNNSEDDSISKIKEYCEGKIEIKSDFFEYNPNNKPIKIFEYSKENFENLGSESELSDLSSNRKLILIKNCANKGFAGGNNIGIRCALNNINSQYILLLNNDTIVDPNFLTELIKAAENDKKVGSVQSLLLKPDRKFIDSLGQEISIWRAMDKGMNLRYDKSFKKDREIFGACAAAAIYKKNVLKNIGLFDESFFVIYEDVDLSWRIRLNGFKSILAANSIVYHKRGISENTNQGELSNLMKYHYAKNWLIIMLKYYPVSCIFGGENLNKFIFFLKESINCSLKVNRSFEFAKIILNNLYNRINVHKSPLLDETQKNWIKQ